MIGRRSSVTVGSDTIEHPKSVGDRQDLLIPTGESPFEKASLNHS